MFLRHLNLTANRCESLSFDVVLKFTNKVAEDDTIFIIQRAILDGKLGELGVNISHVIGIPPVEGLLLFVTNTAIINFRVVSA